MSRPVSAWAPSRMWHPGVVLVAVVVATLLPLVPAAAQEGATTADRSGLPDVASGPRPGPDALYLPPPDAPQLQNVGPWQAEPTLISGTQAYRQGEWLYQDFLFDDHGATGVVDPEDPYGPGTNLYSPPAGTFTYPTDEVYAHNAADLVEARITVLEGATAIRITLNTLIEPERTAVTLALGDAGTHDWPHGAGASSPAEIFLTAHGETAELLDAATGEALTPAATVAVDLDRRQLDLRIPHAAWDPGRNQVPVTVGVGLWDPDGGTYLAPQPGAATADTPGGGSLVGSALVNVGPRLDEPTPLVAGVTMADTAAGARALAPWWRERQQSAQLLAGDLTPFSTTVDFAKLDDDVTDESTLPTSGPMDRIHASRYVDGQGIEPGNVCFAISSEPTTPGTSCVGRYVGQLQPYAAYVPEGEPPAGGWGLTLLLHSLSANHNQYLSTQNQVQLGDRGEGSIVITPEARGPDGFYTGVPEAATFEAWADIARHHPVNADRVAVSGYSMGGFGTYRLIARWPDLFARGFSVVGVPGTVDDQLASLHNVPLLTWNASADELVHVTEAEATHQALVEAGIEHTYDLFTTADHLTLAGNDEYGPGAAFLGDAEVDRNPPTVHYVVDRSEDSADVVADHAYWLSDLTLHDPETLGTVEAHSAAFGVARHQTLETPSGAGVLTGGNAGALPFTERGVDRIEADQAPSADRLELTATNVAAVTVDPARAGLTCDAEVVVDSEQPVDVVLAGCDDRVQRLDAADPIGLSVLAAEQSLADRPADEALPTSATLATTADFADATTGSSLAAAGPLLLTGPDGLDPRVAAALDRMLDDGAEVRLLGGTAALSEQVEADVRTLGLLPRRLGGATRLETAAAIARHVEARHGVPARYLLARAFGAPDSPTAAWADALSASSPAALHGWPILLTDSAGLSEAAGDVLGDHTGVPVTALGGTTAVGDAVTDAVTAIGNPVDRVAGPTRDETAAAISRQLLGVSEDTEGRRLHVYDGYAADGWAWGLAATSLAAASPLPLLPLDPGGVAVGSARLIACGPTPGVVVALGSAAVLPDAVVAAHLICPDG